MLIQTHNIPVSHVNTSQGVSAPQKEQEAVQVAVPDPAEQNPALRAFAGESAFDPASDKVQAASDKPKIDPSLFGGWAGDRLELGKLIAQNLKNL